MSIHQSNITTTTQKLKLWTEIVDYLDRLNALAPNHRNLIPEQDLLDAHEATKHTSYNASRGLFYAGFTHDEHGVALPDLVEWHRNDLGLFGVSEKFDWSGVHAVQTLWRVREGIRAVMCRELNGLSCANEGEREAMNILAQRLGERAA